MSETLDAVREFHEFFDLPVRDGFTELTPEELTFRLTLITEEFIEVMEAFGRPVEVFRVLDAGGGAELGTTPDYINGYKELADLKYVIDGMDLHLGQRLDDVFHEVHRSNMSKLWACECGCEFANCPLCAGAGEYVKRREDGKILKPPTYSPAEVAPIILEEDN